MSALFAKVKPQNKDEKTTFLDSGWMTTPENENKIVFISPITNENGEEIESGEIWVGGIRYGSTACNCQQHGNTNNTQLVTVDQVTEMINTAIREAIYNAGDTNKLDWEEYTDTSLENKFNDVWEEYDSDMGVDEMIPLPDDEIITQ